MVPNTRLKVGQVPVEEGSDLRGPQLGPSPLLLLPSESQRRVLELAPNLSLGAQYP